MDKKDLIRLYVRDKKSAAEIAILYKASNSRVNYWLEKYKIPKRSISEGVYIKCNPTGDPFKFNPPRKLEEAFLYGLGIGLFWGEGNKKNRNAVRLGNTDPSMIKLFLKFLLRTYGVNKNKIKFGLQTFNDVNPQRALAFWSNFLGYPRKHFFPTVVISNIRGTGTYTKKSRYGVLTIYINNTKLKNLLSATINNIEKMI